MTQEPRPDLPALREEMASMREELARAWAIVDGEPRRLAEAREQGAAEERARLANVYGDRGPLALLDDLLAEPLAGEASE